LFTSIKLVKTLFLKWSTLTLNKVTNGNQTFEMHKQDAHRQKVNRYRIRHQKKYYPSTQVDNDAIIGERPVTVGKIKRIDDTLEENHQRRTRGESGKKYK